ncbi:hypothetical protein ASPFODRAFT_531639 [Aspergillus luchuensis CBS 106.47]|uniref:Uncharacterized protein n=1 Tax=Aspergillus luchuensis (strain CBS 106.47) TaxID=1137211 RepID=A0A1M3TN21_ASPLC|nr:hypothetical protein ASPFODRAFT_531639 [Aspergillus luchuensis CBS 106.47]
MIETWSWRGDEGIAENVADCFFALCGVFGSSPVQGGSSAGYFSAADKSDKVGDRCHQVDECCQVLCGEDGEEINLKAQVCHEPVESLTGQCEKLKVETDEIRRTQAGPAAFCIAADHRSTAAANRRAQNSRWALCVDRILMSQIRECMTQYPNSSPDIVSRFIYLF